MPKVKSGSGRVWYEIEGSDGEPLALIGGYGLLHNQWDFVKPYLVGRHRLVQWNQRGLGQSDRTVTEPFTVEGWVDDLRAVLDDAGIEKTSVWGTSTGSVIGIRFAAKYPERTRSLITYPWFRADETWRRIFATSHQVGEVFGMFSLVRLYTGLVLPPEELYSDVGKEFERFETEAFERNVDPLALGAVVNALSNVDLTSDVANLECPTCVLMGSDSPLNENEDLRGASYQGLVEAFTALKPDAEVATVAGAGSTYLMVTKPEQTAEVVLDFLQRTAPSAVGSTR